MQNAELTELAAISSMYHALRYRADALADKLADYKADHDRAADRIKAELQTALTRLTDRVDDLNAIVYQRGTFTDYTTSVNNALSDWYYWSNNDAARVTTAVADLAVLADRIKILAADASKASSAYDQFSAEYFRLYDAMQAWYKAETVTTEYDQYVSTIADVYTIGRQLIHSLRGTIAADGTVSWPLREF